MHTKAGALESTDMKSKNKVTLADKDGPFRFDRLRNRVQFSECSVRDSVGPVETWLKTLWCIYVLGVRTVDCCFRGVVVAWRVGIGGEQSLNYGVCWWAVLIWRCGVWGSIRYSRALRTNWYACRVGLAIAIGPVLMTTQHSDIHWWNFKMRLKRAWILEDLLRQNISVLV